MPAAPKPDLTSQEFLPQFPLQCDSPGYAIGSVWYSSLDIGRCSIWDDRTR